MEFLADHIGISRSGLYTKIRSLADVTPNELIQITRLKRAAALLKEGKYRINEVSFIWWGSTAVHISPDASRSSLV